LIKAGRCVNLFAINYQLQSGFSWKWRSDQSGGPLVARPPGIRIGVAFFAQHGAGLSETRDAYSLLSPPLGEGALQSCSLPGKTVADAGDHDRPSR
jgi:hypothetical protein